MEYGHGGDVYRNRNVELDFSINVNPLGMPNFVWEAAMKSIALSTRYPDSTCGALRARMSELTGIPGEMMIFGNGAAELIFRLVQTLCPKKAAIPAPSFMEYETALKACGTEVSFFYLKESESFFLNISEYLEFLKKERPDMIFLCTPANPTGAMMRKADLLKILNYCKRAGIVAVIDECFIEFLKWGNVISPQGIYEDIRDGGTADRLWILHGSGTYRADGRKLAAVERIDPGPGSWAGGSFG